MSSISEHSLKVIAWARFPNGEPAPDELRLRVLAPLTVPGFVALEVAYNDPVGDQVPAAWVILRVLEGTAAQQLWPGQLVWQRWRRADERVAIIRLQWPA